MTDMNKVPVTIYTYTVFHMLYDVVNYLFFILLPLPALQMTAKAERFDHDTLKWWQIWKRTKQNITNPTAKMHVLHVMTIDSILFHTILCASFIFGFYLCFVSLHNIRCYLFHINKHLFIFVINFFLSTLRKTFFFFLFWLCPSI